MIFCATRVINFIGLLALAASLPLSERNELVVWSPSFTYPTTGLDVCIGSMIDVQWDASNPPDRIDNPYAHLCLVQNGIRDMQNSLTPTGFLLTDGQVSIRISIRTPPGPSQLLLVGDPRASSSSPTFNIVYC